MTRRHFMQGAAAVLSGTVLGVGPAQARSAGELIKMSVGFPPGGAGDMFARILGAALGEELAAPVIIENKPGGGGMTVAMGFTRAAKDGTQLMMATGSTAVSAPISRARPPYNPVTDFQWIALLTNAPFVIAVNPALPINDLKSLVAYAKARPKKLFYGHAGLGTTVHLAAELFKEMAGIDVTDIAYAGSGGAIVATIAGDVQFVIETAGTLLPYHKSGKLRIITTMADVREKIIPEIGTAKESGYELLAGTSNFLAAPLGTPHDAVDPIAQAVGRVMLRPAVRARLAELGIQPVANSTPALAQAYVASEVARWTPIVKKLGIAL